MPWFDAEALFERLRAVERGHDACKSLVDPRARARMGQDVEFAVTNRLHDACTDLLGSQPLLDEVAHEVVGVPRERAAKTARARASREMDARVDRRRA